MKSPPKWPWTLGKGTGENPRKKSGLLPNSFKNCQKYMFKLFWNNWCPITKSKQRKGWNTKHKTSAHFMLLTFNLFSQGRQNEWNSGGWGRVHHITHFRVTLVLLWWMSGENNVIYIYLGWLGWNKGKTWRS